MISHISTRDTINEVGMPMIHLINKKGGRCSNTIKIGKISRSFHQQYSTLGLLCHIKEHELQDVINSLVQGGI